MSFSSLLRIDRNAFINALKESTLNLDEAVESVIAFRDHLANDLFNIQYEIFITARKQNHQKPELLSKLLGIDSNLSRELLQNDPVEFCFPVIRNDRSELAHGVVIKTSEMFTNVNSAKQHIDRLSKVVRQCFSVIFNTSVVDNSFMLPLYIALMIGEVKQNYIFTGGLDDNLNIKPCKKFHEKERACLKIGKKLLGYEQFSNAEEVLRFLTCQSYDVAFLICFSDKRDKDYLNYSYEKLAKKIDGAIKRELFEKISDTRLIYAAPSLKKGYFDQQIHALYKEINKIVSHGAIPHISFIGPASLAMGIGMALGAHDPVVLYHYQNNEYYRVIDLRKDSRIIKRPKQLTCLKKITFEETGEGKDCAFVIQFASHTPVMDAEEFIKSKKLSTKIIKIFHKEIGGIKISDWTEEVTELMSVIQHVKSRNYFERLHFFLSIPIPIAFALGMALGHFAKISIYQFTNNDQTPYFEAVRSEQLRF